MTPGSPAAPITDHFAVEPVHAELRRRSVRSGFIAAGGRVLQGAISLGSVAILARLLTPSDFGVIAMVMPVTTVVSMTMNFGLHFAILHEERLSADNVNRLFWLAMRFNLVLFVAMALLGPVLAQLYDEPRVTLVAAIWALSMAIQSLATFPEALLKRQLRFGPLTVVHLTGMAAGTVAAVTAAAMGAQHLALVLQFVVWDSVRVVGVLILCRWRPGRPSSSPSNAGIRRMVSYGRNFAMYRGIYWIGRQADRIVVGYVAGAAAAGLYDGARRWSWYPFHELFQSVTDVVVSTLSRARADVERFRAFCRLGFMAFLIIPLATIVFVFVEADRAVRVLLGDQWLEAIPFVRIMCGAAFFDALSRTTMWLYTSEGRTRRQFFWSLITTPVMLIAIAAGSTRGVAGVAWGFAGTTAALMVPTVAWCLHDSVLRWRDFLALAWRPMLTPVLAGLFLTWIRTTLPTAGVLVAFLLHAVIFVVAYVVVWLVLPGGRRVSRVMWDGALAGIGRSAP